MPGDGGRVICRIFLPSPSLDQDWYVDVAYQTLNFCAGLQTSDGSRIFALQPTN